MLPEDSRVLGRPAAHLALHLQLGPLSQYVRPPGPHERHVLVPALGPGVELAFELETAGQSGMLRSLRQWPLPVLLVLLRARLEVALHAQRGAPATELRAV